MARKFALGGTRREMSGCVALAESFEAGQGLFVNSDLVTIDPEIMSGEPVFSGTRVPVQNLVDYLTGGHSLDDFLEGFPGVSREQAVAFLQQASAAFVSTLSLRRKAA